MHEPSSDEVPMFERQITNPSEQTHEEHEIIDELDKTIKTSYICQNPFTQTP